MKLRAKKPSVDTETLADELGEEYAAAFEKEKSAAKNKKSVADRIKSIAEEVGETEGDRCLLLGAKYQVGYITIGARESVDWELFAKQNPKLYAKFLSAAVDETKVGNAIKDGTLSRKLLKKYLKASGKPSRRVVVALIGQEINETEA